ncbi:hypothetical protein Cal6303_0071 [Calothrix sp. PCC 6303]|nr:hypothetical protein Cal6303_0071 [Calothrix sp. PCC 6303]
MCFWGLLKLSRLDIGSMIAASDVTDLEVES